MLAKQVLGDSEKNKRVSEATSVVSELDVGETTHKFVSNRR